MRSSRFVLGAALTAFGFLSAPDLPLVEEVSRPYDRARRRFAPTGKRLVSGEKRCRKRKLQRAARKVNRHV
jgi:hypothetical protein